MLCDVKSHTALHQCQVSQFYLSATRKYCFPTSFDYIHYMTPFQEQSPYLFSLLKTKWTHQTFHFMKHHCRAGLLPPNSANWWPGTASTKDPEFSLLTCQIHLLCLQPGGLQGHFRGKLMNPCFQRCFKNIELGTVEQSDWTLDVKLFHYGTIKTVFWVFWVGWQVACAYTISDSREKQGSETSPFTLFTFDQTKVSKCIGFICFHLLFHFVPTESLNISPLSVSGSYSACSAADSVKREVWYENQSCLSLSRFSCIVESSFRLGNCILMEGDYSGHGLKKKCRIVVLCTDWW